MATPPCQGMSTAGQMRSDDPRNTLIIPTVKMIKKLLPKFALIENVPQFFDTLILNKNKSQITIADYIDCQLSNKYSISKNIINMNEFGIPQFRKRSIVLLSRKDLKEKWQLPKKAPKKVTVNDVIGHIPPIDPFVKDISEKELLELFPKFHERKEKALQLSKYNKPPIHIKRQVIAMMHTASGQTAFNNLKYKPIKENGNLVKGFKNTYKRQDWDKPSSAITMDNRKISSQNNVHPGLPYKKGGTTLYSDPRTYTLYELFKLMTLPEDWQIPKTESEAFIRRLIGEGIPPKFVKQLFKQIIT